MTELSPPLEGKSLTSEGSRPPEPIQNAAAENPQSKDTDRSHISQLRRRIQSFMSPPRPQSTGSPENLPSKPGLWERLTKPQPIALYNSREISAFQRVFGSDAPPEALDRLHVTYGVNVLSSFIKRREWDRMPDINEGRLHYVFNEVVTEKYYHRVLKDLGWGHQLLGKFGELATMGTYNKGQREWKKIMDVVSSVQGKEAAEDMERRAYILGETRQLAEVYDAHKTKPETFRQIADRVDGQSFYKKRTGLSKVAFMAMASLLGGGNYTPAEGKTYKNQSLKYVVIGANVPIVTSIAQEAVAMLTAPTPEYAIASGIVMGLFATIGIALNAISIPSLLTVKYHEGCHAVSFRSPMGSMAGICTVDG